MAVLALSGAAAAAMGVLAMVGADAAPPAPFSATASIAPANYYIGDSAGSVYTFTVTNTGSTASLGAVEIDRPDSTWSITDCLGQPSGWAAQDATTKCRFRSANSTSDDILPGQSRTFQVRATTAPGTSNHTGTWGVVVSKSNQFDTKSLLKNAAPASTGALTTTQYTFELTDAVVSDTLPAAGAACPAANKEAVTGSTHNILVCGRNRATIALTPVAGQSSLGGTFIASPGTFSSGSIPAGSGDVVVARWAGAHVTGSYGIADKTVTAKVGSSSSRTSPLPFVTFTGYSALNQPPVANDDSYSTNEDTALVVAAPGVLGNDTDAESDPLTAVLDTDVSHGVLALASNGSFTYTPDADYNGPDSFTYHANDGIADGNTATVSITVDPVNDAPVATDVTDSTDEDTPKVVTLSATDVDGDTLTFSIVDPPSHGTLGTVTGDSVTYTPDANYFGPDSFTFKANDGTVDSNTATVNLTVNSVNDAPVANADSYSTNEDTALVVAAPGVLTNDTDVESDPLTAVLDTDVSHGALTLNSDGSFSYTPDADYNGPDSFTYHANDGSLDSNVTTVDLTVDAVNDAPVATDVTDSTDEDTPKLITLSASDVDGDSLTYSIVDPPLHGTLGTVSGDSVTYTPDANYFGSDSFTFKANDGTVDSNTATVNLTVNSVNDAPVATGDSYSTNEDTALVVFAPGVLTNDTDVEGDPLTAVLDADVSHGALTLNSDGSFSYTPDANYNGPDSFTYHANDGTDDSNVVTVDLTVNAVNDAPVATDVTDSTDEDTPKAITLTATDADGDTLTFSIVDPPSHGTLGTVTGDSVTYTPDANYHGSDSFTFKANDGTVDSNTATVSLTVNSVNDAPVANDDSYQAIEDTPLVVAAPGVLGNDTDVDGDSLTAGNASTPAHGSVSLAADGSFTYTPDSGYTGPDSFTYDASDGTATDTATVSITVVPPNTTPTADNTSASGNEDGGAITVNLSGDDADGDGLTFVVDAATNGTVGTPTAPVCTNPTPPASHCTSTVSYTPNANYFGPDSFTYHVNDGTIDSADATASITVDSVNDAPSFTKGADQTVNEDATAQTVSGWATAISPGPANESTQTVTFVVTNDNNALFSAQPAVSSAGTLTFTPAANANGSAIVTIHAHDDGGTANGGVDDSANQTFTITVNAVNDAPSFTKGADQTVDEDAGAQTVNPWATAISPGPANESAQTVSFEITANDNTALFSAGPAVSSTGVLTYTAGANKHGVANVTLRIKDDGGTANGGVDTSATQSFVITVNAVNDPPVAEAKTFSAQTNMKISLGGLLTNAQDTADTSQNGGYTPTFTLASVTINNCTGCTVSNVNTAAGTFDFDPPAGGTGAFTLNYKIHDTGDPGPGVDSADTLITINVSGPVIWFVDNAVTGPGTGRLSDPFKTLASAAAVDAANHRIFLKTGTYSDGITLNSGEWLTGSGAIATDFDTLMGISPPAGTIARPAINTTAPTVQGAVVLGSGDTLRGVTLSGSTALSGTSFGTLTLSSGVAADVAIDTTGGGLNLNTGTISGDFASTNSDGGTNNVLLNAVSSTGTSLGTGNLQNATAEGFKVTGGTGTFSYAGQVLNATGATVSIGSKTGGTVTLSGLVSDTAGPGVALTSNTGATINFTGGVTLTSGTSAAFSATGGGTVNVTGASNTLASTTGTALTVTSTTIGSSGLTFRRIDSNGAVNGILLNGTGSSGGLTVAGSGTSGSGGTITASTGDGISLTSTNGVALNRMIVSNSTANGIHAVTVNGFTLADSTVSGNGTSAALDHDGVHLTDVTGTSSITNTTVTGSKEHNTRWVNSSGSATITVSGSTFSSNDASVGASGLFLDTQGTASMNATVNNNTFTSNRITGVQIFAEAASPATMVGNVGTNTFTGNHTGVDVETNGTNSATYVVNGENITGSSSAGAGIVAFKGSLATSNALVVTIENSTINNGDEQAAPGIWVHGEVSGAIRATITGNTVTHVGHYGIDVSVVNGSPSLDTNISNNNVNIATVANALYGINVESGAIASDASAVCANIKTNTSVGGSGLEGIGAFNSAAGSFRLPGFAGGTDAQAAAFIASGNTATATAFHSSVAFTGGAACNTP